MSYATLQKDLERITLKKDLDRVLERMVDFEEEVNRKEKEGNTDITGSSAWTLGCYLFGFTLGYYTAKRIFNINGRSEDNQRRES